MQVETKGRVNALDFAIEVLETRSRYSREPEKLLRLLDTAITDIKKLRRDIDAEKRGEATSAAMNAARPKEDEWQAGTG